MEIVLGIATVSEKLTVTLNYYHEFVDVEKIRKVRARAEQLLKSLIE